MKKLIFSVLLAISCAAANAQSGTNSPYSMYGLGQLSELSSGFNRGMNGVGISFADNNQVNILNPASYSNIDSLTFIFDAGLSLQLTNFSENGVKKNAKNADFEYAIGGFRVCKGVGAAFGLLPYTNVGYNFSNKTVVEGTQTLNTAASTVVNTYSGSGGLHQVLLGIGASPIKNLSVGVNFSYMFGTINRTVANAYSDVYAKSLARSYSASMNSYKLEFGAQYTYNMKNRNSLTIGATYTPGHKTGSNPELTTISTNAQTSVADTVNYTIQNGLELPTQIGVGVSYKHSKKWRVGLDYTLQQWSKVVIPVFDTRNHGTFVAATGMFNDRHKINLGGEYCQNEDGRSFASRIRYRLGVGYTTPYLKIAGQDGPSELSVSAGFGIPIVNSYNNRSILNISAQWVRASQKDLITENTFRINVGLTFNERWFAKWKFE